MREFVSPYGRIDHLERSFFNWLKKKKSISAFYPLDFKPAQRDNTIVSRSGRDSLAGLSGTLCLGLDCHLMSKRLGQIH